MVGSYSRPTGSRANVHTPTPELVHLDEGPMTKNALVGVTRDAVAAAMRRAFELAARGPATGVNPQVGCVILGPDGITLSEGWHRGAGSAHAEVDALAKLAPSAARGSIAVVTLEPCNHVGRTGPCALALIEAGVSQVIYAVTDPGEHSRGGTERLRSNGIDVHGGCLLYTSPSPRD